MLKWAGGLAGLKACWAEGGSPCFACIEWAFWTYGVYWLLMQWLESKPLRSSMVLFMQALSRNAVWDRSARTGDWKKKPLVWSDIETVWGNRLSSGLLAGAAGLAQVDSWEGHAGTLQCAGCFPLQLKGEQCLGEGTSGWPSRDAIT